MKILYTLATILLLASCSKDDFDLYAGKESENKIHIGGIQNEGLALASVATRAAGVNAETVSWLLQPLKTGLDITYGLYNVTPNHQDVAILKLEDSDGEGDKPYDTDAGLAVYSFKYRADRKTEVGDGNDAIWYNNGYHYFQGVNVPERIRYTSEITEIEGTGKAPGLTSDQHNANDTGADAEMGNYTLLSHYLGMPANYRLTATVERIKLPFRHRLARVVAFVLIDPELNTTLKGYKKNADGTASTTEDPTTTSIRFCNVKVLQGVRDQAELGVEGGGHHTLTPKWGQARKVIPHFDGERGSYNYKTLTELDENFKFYYKESDGKSSNLYPTTDGWKSVHDASTHNGYKEINYGKVPVYDIIVRPTYTNVDNVMYDEEDYANTTKRQELANQTNSIDFDIELANGLRYEKKFDFDLNANYQTVVYLRISREHVDYNDAGSDLWVEEKNNNDGWYGVDNKNGNTLSYAGSSWQRAYTYGYEVGEDHTNPNHQNGVTDGHFYDANSSEEEREKAQYFTSAYQNIWVEKFLQAYKGGKHHGDYFILRDDITIDANLLPVGFVFTGHLDGQDHTITLTGINEWKECDNEVLAKLKHKNDNDDDEYSPVPQLYWMEEVAQVRPMTRAVIDAGSPVKIDMDSSLPAVLTQLDSKGKSVLYEEDGVYKKYTNRTFYKNTGSALFNGLNGTYTTAQEANSSIPANQWEANVHKETNKSTVWVPTAGYRAEVLNLVMAAGTTIFTADAVVTGNVQNCFNTTSDGKEAVTNTPNIPQYK